MSDSETCDASIEEEKARVFYVAVTRAKVLLVVCWMKKDESKFVTELKAAAKQHRGTD